VAEEWDGSGVVERTYTYGVYIDEPITMTTAGGTGSAIYYYHTNNMYNVRALTDSSGNVVERYRYSAYGAVTIFDDQGNQIARSAYGNRYMFQGRRLDEATGLYYHRNRYYSAALGRFVTRDPMGYVDGYNLYQYAGSYPTTASDPMGLWVCGEMVCADNWLLFTFADNRGLTKALFCRHVGC
jgi:RHS repeat-associated protein